MKNDRSQIFSAPEDSPYVCKISAQSDFSSLLMVNQKTRKCGGRKNKKVSNPISKGFHRRMGCPNKTTRKTAGTAENSARLHKPLL